MWCLFFSKSIVKVSLIVCYLTYVFLIDKSPKNGSRRAFMRDSIRTRKWWSYACDFFPITLVKTADLDPDKSYIMGYHPHGIISVGAMMSFATESVKTVSLVSTENDTHQDGKRNERGFSSLFPGIERRLITLPQNFTTPFLREYLLSMGCCDSAKETFRNVLARNSGKGNAVVVVVGGAAESMHVQPGGMDLVLKTRRGFVREAILANASLVPVIAFGENDLYLVFEPGQHWVARVQNIVKNFTGIAVPIFRGRSIFFKDFGLMPRRSPVVVVAGAPIEPPTLTAERRRNFQPKFDRQTNKPSNEDGKTVDALHATYVKALEELYAKLKDAKWNSPGRNRMASLRIN